jgi:hypothetical protein
MVWPSPSRKSVRSKSGRYPQPRSGALMEVGVNKAVSILLILFSRSLRPRSDPRCERRNRAKTFWAYIVHGHITQCSSCTLEVIRIARITVAFAYLERQISRLHPAFSLLGSQVAYFLRLANGERLASSNSPASSELTCRVGWVRHRLDWRRFQCGGRFRRQHSSLHREPVRKAWGSNHRGIRRCVPSAGRRMRERRPTRRRRT